MEERFKDLDVSYGSFVLDEVNALNYLDYVARQHLEQVLNNEEDYEGMTEMLEDITEMKKDIIEHGYEFVKFIECPMSASQINILPMIEEQKLKEAIEDVAEWANNNCNAEDMPLIFKAKKDQALFEKYLKEMQEK